MTEIPPNCRNSHSVPGAPMPGIGDACAPSPSLQPGYISPETWLMARSEYQYMRFGLTFTLMGDGYYTHELGDSLHGDDWDYDELTFALGLPVGNASAADVLDPNPRPVPPPIPLTQAWGLYVRSPSTSNASWAFDTAVVPSAGSPPSVRVDIVNTAASSDGIDLSQLVSTFQDGGYLLSFWGKASRDGTALTLNSRKNGGDWHNFGLDASLTLSTQWAQYNITFVSSSDGTAGRLSWFMGKAAPATSVWINSPTLSGVSIPPPVFVREFECGIAVLNGDTEPRTVLLNATGAAPLRRLTGQQAPLHQYFVDDASSAFSVVSGSWSVGDYDSGYHWSTTPSQEEVRPANGFYHHWASGAHHATGGVATFALQVPVAGVYDLSMWWPAAVPARAGWAEAMNISLASGAAVTVNLRTQGGDAFLPLFKAVALDPSSTLTVACSADGGECIADAVLVESAARLNDGSAAETVTLQPMDGIILQRAAGVPPHCAQHSM